jgi:hypothetical protein
LKDIISKIEHSFNNWTHIQFNSDGVQLFWIRFQIFERALQFLSEK